MTNQALATLENITDEQIRALRTEAGQAGDMEMVKICDRALMWESEHQTALRYDADGRHDRAAAWEDVRRCERARVKCADAINATRAMEES